MQRPVIQCTPRASADTAGHGRESAAAAAPAAAADASRASADGATHGAESRTSMAFPQMRRVTSPDVPAELHMQELVDELACSAAALRARGCPPRASATAGGAPAAADAAATPAASTPASSPPTGRHTARGTLHTLGRWLTTLLPMNYMHDRGWSKVNEEEFLVEHMLLFGPQAQVIMLMLISAHILGGTSFAFSLPRLGHPTRAVVYTVIHVLIVLILTLMWWYDKQVLISMYARTESPQLMRALGLAPQQPLQPLSYQQQQQQQQQQPPLHSASRSAPASPVGFTGRQQPGGLSTSSSSTAQHSMQRSSSMPAILAAAGSSSVQGLPPERSQSDSSVDSSLQAPSTAAATAASAASSARSLQTSAPSSVSGASRPSSDPSPAPPQGRQRLVRPTASERAQLYSSLSLFPHGRVQLAYVRHGWRSAIHAIAISLLAIIDVSIIVDAIVNVQPSLLLPAVYGGRYDPAGAAIITALTLTWAKCGSLEMSGKPWHAAVSHLIVIATGMVGLVVVYAPALSYAVGLTATPPPPGVHVSAGTFAVLITFIAMDAYSTIHKVACRTRALQMVIRRYQTLEGLAIVGNMRHKAALQRMAQDVSERGGVALDAVLHYIVSPIRDYMHAVEYLTQDLRQLMSRSAALDENARRRRDSSHGPSRRRANTAAAAAHTSSSAAAAGDAGRRRYAATTDKQTGAAPQQALFPTLPPRPERLPAPSPSPQGTPPEDSAARADVEARERSDVADIHTTAENVLALLSAMDTEVGRVFMQCALEGAATRAAVAEGVGYRPDDEAHASAAAASDGGARGRGVRSDDSPYITRPAEELVTQVLAALVPAVRRLRRVGPSPERQPQACPMEAATASSRSDGNASTPSASEEASSITSGASPLLSAAQRHRIVQDIVRNRAALRSSGSGDGPGYSLRDDTSLTNIAQQQPFVDSGISASASVGTNEAARGGGGASSTLSPLEPDSIASEPVHAGAVLADLQHTAHSEGIDKLVARHSKRSLQLGQLSVRVPRIPSPPPAAAAAAAAQVRANTTAMPGGAAHNVVSPGTPSPSGSAWSAEHAGADERADDSGAGPGGGHGGGHGGAARKTGVWVWEPSTPVSAHTDVAAATAATTAPAAESQSAAVEAATAPPAVQLPPAVSVSPAPTASAAPTAPMKSAAQMNAVAASAAAAVRAGQPGLIATATTGTADASTVVHTVAVPLMLTTATSPGYKAPPPTLPSAAAAAAAASPASATAPAATTTTEAAAAAAVAGEAGTGPARVGQPEQLPQPQKEQQPQQQPQQQEPSAGQSAEQQKQALKLFQQRMSEKELQYPFDYGFEHAYRKKARTAHGKRWDTTQRGMPPTSAAANVAKASAAAEEATGNTPGGGGVAAFKHAITTAGIRVNPATIVRGKLTDASAVILANTPQAAGTGPGGSPAPMDTTLIAPAAISQLQALSSPALSASRVEPVTVAAPPLEGMDAIPGYKGSMLEVLMTEQMAARREREGVGVGVCGGSGLSPGGGDKTSGSGSSSGSCSSMHLTSYLKPGETPFVDKEDQREPKMSLEAGNIEAAGSGRPFAGAVARQILARSGGGGGGGKGSPPHAGQDANSTGSAGSPSRTPGLGLHVLICDDEKLNRKVVARLLSRLGCTWQSIEDASDITAALAMSNRPFDVILLDIIMQKTNGLEICRQLRDAHVHIPIIAATANFSTREAALYRAAGFTRVLTKPFNAQDLSAALTQALGIQLQQTVGLTTGLATVVSAGQPSQL